MFVAGRRADALAGTVEAVVGAGGAATAVAADLRDPGAVDGLVDRAMNDTGRLDVMVNNAGVSFRGRLADGDTEAWREMLEVNVLALAVGSRAAIPGPTATNLARHHPDVLRGMAASLGAEIGPPTGGLFPTEALDRVAAAGQVLASADDVARAVLFANHPAHWAEHLRDHRPAGQAAGRPGMNPPRGDAEARRSAILDAALQVFGQYSYRRASMDDIAREVGIAKGTIYLSFTSKEEVFRALSRRLAQRMLSGAEAARHRPGSTADKLAAMHTAWFGTYAETISRSPHAAELLDAKHQLSADLAADAASRYKRLVRNVLTDAVTAGELDLESAGLTADTAAELLIGAARGLQSSASSPATYRRHLNTLVRVMIAGLSRRRPADAV